MRRWVRRFLIATLLLFPIIFISLTYLEDIAETATGREGTEGLIAFIRGLPGRVIDLASTAGYAGIFMLMLLEAAAFPIPSEIILPFAGYLVSQGAVDFWPVIFYSTIAALTGSFIDYYLGLKLGTPILTGRARLPFVDTARLQRVEVWFNRYGAVAVALFRLVPAARVLISFPAGAYHMGKSKFAAYTLAGCLPWNLTLVYLGWWLGTSWGTVVEAFRYINLIAYGFLALLIVWVGLRLASKRKPNYGETG